MNDEKLIILDACLRNALVVFLVFLLAFLAYSLLRFRQRRKQLAEYFEDRYMAVLEADEREAEGRHFTPKIALLQPLFRSLILSLVLATASFLFFALAPFPFLHNFATARNWQTSPLRLTLLQYERFHEGFSLDGEVWNQTEEAFEGVQAIIKIRDHQDDILDELAISVRPDPLQPGRAGQFELRYTEHSPFLSSYQVTFRNSEGRVLPHVEGFDVR